MATSEVWAGKVNPYYNEATGEAIRLGTIEFKTFSEAFIKTLRMYNKNASKHLYDPQFIFNGRVYTCMEYGEQSKTGRGTTRYWTVSQTSAKKMPVTFYDNYEITHDYLMRIPKSKVNDPNWRHYIQ